MFLYEVQPFLWAGGGRVKGEEYGITSPSHPQGGELLATALQEAVSEKQIISRVLGFLQFPVLNLSVPGPSACPTSQISCMLSLVCGWDSKLPRFKGPGKVRSHPTPPSSPGELYGALSCPRKAVTVSTWRLESTVTHSEKLQPDYLSFLEELVPYSCLSEKGSYTEG